MLNLILKPPRIVVYYSDEDPLTKPGEDEDEDLSIHVRKCAERYAHVRADTVSIKNDISMVQWKVDWSIRIISSMLALLIIEEIASFESILSFIGL